MGKKFITLVARSKKYRLFSEDIQNVFQKPIRKIPLIPRYMEAVKTYEDDTEESCQTNEDLQHSLKLIWYYYFLLFFTISSIILGKKTLLINSGLHRSPLSFWRKILWTRKITRESWSQLETCRYKER